MNKPGSKTLREILAEIERLIDTEGPSVLDRLVETEGCDCIGLCSGLELSRGVEADGPSVVFCRL
jgi:hypothetical protein